VTDLSTQLNPAQLEAVTTIDGAVLVVAGAGSGKTRVIEYRALHLVQQGAAPESILLLTFTRRAAREMISRAAVHDPRCFRSADKCSIQKDFRFCDPVFDSHPVNIQFFFQVFRIIL